MKLPIPSEWARYQASPRGRSMLQAFSRLLSPDATLGDFRALTRKLCGSSPDGFCSSGMCFALRLATLDLSRYESHRDLFLDLARPGAIIPLSCALHAEFPDLFLPAWHLDRAVLNNIARHSGVVFPLSQPLGPDEAFALNELLFSYGRACGISDPSELCLLLYGYFQRKTNKKLTA